jgi:tripartite-type tricarboxylate transporter receptor subunit TctC
MSAISRRGLLAAPLFAATAAPAQPFARTSRFVVGFAPGGATDTIARLFAERLRRAYIPTLQVENRTGAAGRLAAEAVKDAAPDASALLVTPGSVLTVYPHTYRDRLRYDPLVDFAPVTPLCTAPYALMVAAGHPARDFADFRAWARGQRNPPAFASPAAGSAPHFLGVALAREIGVAMEHVPYRGMAPALQDLLSGNLPSVVCILGEGAELHHSWRARILAVSSAQRIPRLPDVPTFAELGHASLIAEEWFGLLAPRGTPGSITEPLHAAIAGAAASPELREALRKLEYRPLIEPRARFAQRIAADQQRWAPIVAESGFLAEE